MTTVEDSRISTTFLKYMGPLELSDYHDLLRQYRTWEDWVVANADPTSWEVRIEADQRYAAICQAWYVASEEQRAQYVGMGIAGAVDAMKRVVPTELQPLSTRLASAKAAKRGKRR